MKKLNREFVSTTKHPVKIMQFGEGNFLRAFIDWMIDAANKQGVIDAGVVVVQPLENGMVELLKQQDCLYHVYLEGIRDKQVVKEVTLVESIQDALNPYTEYEKYQQYALSEDLQVVISNTTEAGIRYEEGEDIFATPAKSFPGKMTALLYNRFKHFQGALDKGLAVVCCELIENNGTTLHEFILKHAAANNLGDDFTAWIDSACSFYDTLVDRIVPGFPHDSIDAIKEEIGFDDNLVVKGEFYHLWAIGGKSYAAIQELLPLDKAGLHVLYMPSIKSFRDKKVRVLNGSHTAMVPVGIQQGCETVMDAFNDKQVEAFVNRMVAEEVLPMIDEPREELENFAQGILERFYNPFIKHFLATISLNSLSKWEARNFPTLKDNYTKKGVVAPLTAFSLASLLVLYSGKAEVFFTPNDTKEHLDFIATAWSDNDVDAAISLILSNRTIWSEDLLQVEGLAEIVGQYAHSILDNGMQVALQNVLDA